MKTLLDVTERLDEVAIQVQHIPGMEDDVREIIRALEVIAIEEELE